MFLNGACSIAVIPFNPRKKLLLTDLFSPVKLPQIPGWKNRCLGANNDCRANPELIFTMKQKISYSRFGQKLWSLAAILSLAVSNIHVQAATDYAAQLSAQLALAGENLYTASASEIQAAIDTLLLGPSTLGDAAGYLEVASQARPNYASALVKGTVATHGITSDASVLAGVAAAKAPAYAASIVSGAIGGAVKLNAAAADQSDEVAAAVASAIEAIPGVANQRAAIAKAAIAGAKNLTAANRDATQLAVLTALMPGQGALSGVIAASAVAGDANNIPYVAQNAVAQADNKDLAAAGAVTGKFTTDGTKFTALKNAVIAGGASGWVAEGVKASKTDPANSVNAVKTQITAAANATNVSAVLVGSTYAGGGKAKDFVAEAVKAYKASGTAVADTLSFVQAGATGNPGQAANIVKSVLALSSSDAGRSIGFSEAGSLAAAAATKAEAAGQQQAGLIASNVLKDADYSIKTQPTANSQRNDIVAAIVGAAPSQAALAMKSSVATIPAPSTNDSIRNDMIKAGLDAAGVAGGAEAVALATAGAVNGLSKGDLARYLGANLSTVMGSMTVSYNDTVQAAAVTVQKIRLDVTGNPALRLAEAVADPAVATGSESAITTAALAVSTPANVSGIAAAGVVLNGVASAETIQASAALLQPKKYLQIKASVGAVVAVSASSNVEATVTKLVTDYPSLVTDTVTGAVLARPGASQQIAFGSISAAPTKSGPIITAIFQHANLTQLTYAGPSNSGPAIAIGGAFNPVEVAAAAISYEAARALRLPSDSRASGLDTDGSPIPALATAKLQNNQIKSLTIAAVKAALKFQAAKAVDLASRDGGEAAMTSGALAGSLAGIDLVTDYDVAADQTNLNTNGLIEAIVIGVTKAAPWYARSIAGALATVLTIRADQADNEAVESSRMASLVALIEANAGSKVVSALNALYGDNAIANAWAGAKANAVADAAVAGTLANFIAGLSTTVNTPVTDITGL